MICVHQAFSVLSIYYSIIASLAFPHRLTLSCLNHSWRNQLALVLRISNLLRIWLYIALIHLRGPCPCSCIPSYNHKSQPILSLPVRHASHQTQSYLNSINIFLVNFIPLLSIVHAFLNSSLSALQIDRSGMKFTKKMDFVFELWIGVKGQTNPEIAGSLRNLFR